MGFLPSFVLSEMEKKAAEFLSGMNVDEIATEEDCPDWDPFSEKRPTSVSQVKAVAPEGN